MSLSEYRKLSLNDMVKIGCRDCEGCSQCCQDMGQSIILNPWDVFQMEKHLDMSFEQLLEGPVELHVEESLILPNLKMQEYQVDQQGKVQVHQIEQCYFLNEKGRCSIHDFRPGICRLFPLGRDYADHQISYFLLEDACPAKNKTKQKVQKWLGIDAIQTYENYLLKWHDFVKTWRNKIQEHATDDQLTKQMNMVFLQLFFLKPYETEDFYQEFEMRLDLIWQMFSDKI